MTKTMLQTPAISALYQQELNTVHKYRLMITCKTKREKKASFKESPYLQQPYPQPLQNTEKNMSSSDLNGISSGKEKERMSRCKPEINKNM
jgi:hypothetical protein